MKTTTNSKTATLGKKILLVVTLFLLALSPVQAQQNSFQVTVTGKGNPIILIPGYSCSGEVWNETVAHLKNNYELHVITIAGFGGVAPIQSEELLKTVRNEIIQYTKEKKLHKPILIGHSLGAFMTLWLHSTAPDTFGKSICVDGLPFLSAIGKPETTQEMVRANPQYNKQAVINNFKSLPTQGYIENMTQSLLSQVTDTNRAKQIAQWSFNSDRATLGSTIVEMATTDLRSEIANIKAPILIMASLFGTKEASEKEYNTQYAALKNKTLKVANAKHFIMYDQPEWFYNEIDLFLASK